MIRKFLMGLGALCMGMQIQGDTVICSITIKNNTHHQIVVQGAEKKYIINSLGPLFTWRHLWHTTNTQRSDTELSYQLGI